MDAVGASYHLLRQVKGGFSFSTNLFKGKGKAMMKDLAKSPYGKEEADLLAKLKMGFNPTDNPEETNRRAVLAVADAYQLLAVWDWLEHMGSKHEDAIAYLGSILAPLLREMDDHPYYQLGGSRILSKSLASSYLANKQACLDYLGGNYYEEAYNTRVNMLFKHYLHLPIIFLEGDTDGI